jgi:hypothetical protein
MTSGEKWKVPRVDSYFVQHKGLKAEIGVGFWEINGFL